MKKAFIIMAVLTTISSTFGQQQTELRKTILSRYVGEWTNVDQNTRDISKVIITNDGGLFIQAFGSCAPKDCDMGIVKVNEIAASVDSIKNILPFDYCIAIWEADFANHTMKFKVGNGPNPELHIETFTIFKDESGRSNYHVYSVMRKTP